MANNVDTDQTAPKEQSDLGLHFLLMHFCTSIYNHYTSLVYGLVNCTSTISKWVNHRTLPSWLPKHAALKSANLVKFTQIDLQVKLCVLFRLVIYKAHLVVSFI